MGAVAPGVIVFVAVAAIMGYAVMSAPPPLDEKIATFEGTGNRTTRAFGVSGYWGYEQR